MKTRFLPPMKGTRKLTRYGVASGRVMVREASLLDWQTIERLIGSDFSECMNILSDTVYGPYLAGAKGSEDIDSRLIEFLKAQYNFVDEVSPGSFIGLFFRIKYDFHNLKGAFKEKNSNRPGAQVFLDLGT
ncbi:MAG: V-type ATPase subunit, partial [Actinomycetota bacterium]|nr:V-type ATPase subunit [Actinomycetota bacterium]